MSTKKTKSVQHAAEPSPEEDSEPVDGVQVVSAGETSEEQTQESASVPVLFDLRKFSKGDIEKAEALGIPITEIANTMNAYVASVEARFEVLGKAVNESPSKVIEELKKEASKARQEYAQQHAHQASSGEGGGMPSGDIGGILSLVERFSGGGGSGSNPMMEKFMNSMIETSMRRLAESESFDNVFREWMVKKMAKDLGEPLVMSAVKTSTA